jgi:hypothetical protein
MEEMAKQSTLYALQNGVEHQMSAEDIGKFLGLLLFSEYHSVPS